MMGTESREMAKLVAKWGREVMLLVDLSYTYNPIIQSFSSDRYSYSYLYFYIFLIILVTKSFAIFLM